MRRRRCPSLLWILIACTAGTGVARAQEQYDVAAAQRIIHAHINAHGGIERIERLNSARIRAVSLQQDHTLDVVLYKKRPDLVRFEIRSDEGHEFFTSNEDGAWHWSSRSDAAATPIEGERRRLLELQGRFAGALLGADPGTLLAFEAGANDPDTGKPAFYRFRIPSGSGGYEDVYLDGETYLETHSAYYPDSDAEPLITRLEDYRMVDGYPIAHRVVQTAGGAILADTRLTDVRLNLGLGELFFRPPRSRMP